MVVGIRPFNGVDDVVVGTRPFYSGSDTQVHARKRSAKGCGVLVVYPLPLWEVESW